MAIYMKATNISGGVTDDNYSGWSRVDHLYTRLHRPAIMKIGQTTDREKMLPQFSHLVVIKPRDLASSSFFELALNGDVLPTVEIHQLDGGKSALQLKILLNNVIISHYEEQLLPEGRASEIIELNYTKIERTYFGKDHQGVSLSPVVHGYDLQKAVKL